MECKIILKENEFPVHKISDKLSEILKMNDNLKKIYSLLTNVCCYDNDRIIIFYINEKSEFCYLINSGIEDAYIFFIMNFLNEKELELKTAFGLLTLAKEIIKDEVKMFELFNILHWPSSKKGLDYLNSINDFSDRLKTLVFEKKLSIKEAFLFHNSFFKNYDELLNSFPKSLTYTELSEVVRNICEYSKRENKSIDEILEKLVNIDENKKVEFIYNLRYPLFSGYIKIFKSFIKEIDLPRAVILDFDNTFENDTYSLSIKFKNAMSLLKKINKLSENIGSYLKKKEAGFIYSF